MDSLNEFYEAASQGNEAPRSRSVRSSSLHKGELPSGMSFELRAAILQKEILIF